MKLKNYIFFAGMLALLTFSACNNDPETDDKPTPPDQTSIVLSADNLSFASADAAPQSVSVTASDQSWTVDIPSTNKWLSAEAEISETGGEIVVSVTDNEGLDARSSYVYVRLFDKSDSVLVTQIGQSPVITLSETSKETDEKAATLAIGVTANVEYNVTIDENCNWIGYELKNNGALLELSIDENTSTEPRSATVTLRSEQHGVSASIEIRQAAGKPDSDRVRETDDIFVPFASATANATASAYPIENINDNDLGTFWQTPSRGATPNAEITFDFGEKLITRIDYMVYYPSTPYGQFGEADVYYTTGAGTEIFLTSHNFGMKDTQDTIRFGEQGISQVKSITLKVKTANGRESSTGVLAGIAELEFFRTQALREISEIFTDNSCSEVLPGITSETVENIEDPLLRNLATQLIAGTYNSDFRLASYRAYPHPDEDARRFGTNTYTKYDNVTGMCITRPGTYHIAVQTNGNPTPIYMDVINWENNFYGGNCAFTLSEGMNVIEIPEKKGSTQLVPGIIYLRIHTPNYDRLNPVTIHFLDAEVNGYFDAQKTDPNRFGTLLENAKAPEFDMVGRKVIFTTTVTNLQKNITTGERAQKYMELADTVVTLEEDLQGHYKYNTGGHRNRLLIGPAYGGFMFAASYIVGFGPDLVANPDNLAKGFWGMAHEIGHCNQIGKRMNWAGTTEVTNNICSSYVEYTMRGAKEKAATTPLTDKDFFNQAIRDIALNPEKSIDHFSAGSWDAMYYEKVVPFWQLYLYFTYVGGYPDLYRDAYNIARNSTDNQSISDGKAQIEFVKMMSDLTKTDLTEFFEFWRFLSPTENVYINDYGCRTMTITQAMVDEAKSHMSQYDKPKHKIQYICEGNINRFISSSAPTAGQMTTSSQYVRASGFSGIVAYELCDGPDKTVAIYLPKTSTVTGVLLYNRYTTLQWTDSNGNASPGNVNSQTYYCSKNTPTTIPTADYTPYVYGITADGTRIPATNNPK